MPATLKDQDNIQVLYSLMEHPGWAVYQTLLLTMAERFQKPLGHDHSKTPPDEVKYIVGYASGALRALSNIINLSSRLKKQNPKYWEDARKIALAEMENENVNTGRQKAGA